jgi:hypothetical protein
MLMVIDWRTLPKAVHDPIHGLSQPGVIEVKKAQLLRQLNAHKEKPQA